MKYDDINLSKIRELPIFDVCSRLGITLKGRGKLTKRAMCWYHDDHHPSMRVSQKKNIYKCFVCGEGGDVIKLVQDYEHMTFVEACDWLVREFNVVLIDSGPAPVRRPEPVAPQPPVIVPLDATLVKKSLSLDSAFCQAVVAAGYLSQSQLEHAAERYQLGRSKEGGVIFWEIDDEQRVHAGKIMYYQTDCHRDKHHRPTWVHTLLKDQLPADYELHHCLFGLHLLSGHARVAIVESEKTAVIMSELFPDFVWLSCGGLQMLTPQLLSPLVHCRIIIFPDADPQGEAYSQWADIVREAQHLYRFRYPIRLSPLLEQKATQEQKERKIDLVEFLFEQYGSHV